MLNTTNVSQTKKIFKAKKIITMNPSMPQAQYLACEDGKIVSVGPKEAVAHLMDEYELDTSYENKVLVPGFVEGHAHAMEGGVWKYTYLGFFDRTAPDGKLWTGVKNLAQIQDRLQTAAAELAEGEVLLAWGFDPIYFEGQRISRHDIDAVVSDRKVVILHASFHVLTVNSVMLEASGLDKETSIEGVLVDENGAATGELLEMATMNRVLELLDDDVFDASADPSALFLYAKSAARVGVTTATDLYNPLTPKGVDILKEVTSLPEFGLRLIPAMSALSYRPEEGVERLLSLKDTGNDKLFFGTVKLMTDGSIQGYTARLMYPGYFQKEGESAQNVKGIWNAPPETLTEMVHAYHQAGINLHIHTNGDEATQLMIESIESALSMVPWMNHRHTLQHCQLVNHAQIKRIANANICMNIFANHLYYWGDQHLHATVGYERAQRMEPLRSALNKGVTVAIHSDAPVTPLDPIFSMSCAVNRLTPNGVRLGEYEKVSAMEALEMVTLAPAYSLHLDHLIGSLECGKFADFAVLETCPLTCESEEIKDIKVLATHLGGECVYADSGA